MNSRKCLKLIFLSFIIFLLGFIAGIFLPVGSGFNDTASCRDESSLNEDMYFFISNNVRVIFIALLGSVTFGTTSLTNLILNGTFMGVVLRNAIENGASITDILPLILPHAILEIPAIIIAGAAGFKIPYEILRYLAGKKEQILTQEDIREYLTLALISIILIVIAAWIESNVTLKIAKSMLNSTKDI